MSLSFESEREKAKALYLQRKVMSIITERHWDTENLARRLEMLPVGVEILLERRWDLITAWRVADRLGLFPGVSIRGELHEAD